MYCPNCGKSDQNENTYCRQCGEYLHKLDGLRPFAWGGTTPEQHVNTGLFLNLLSAVASLIVGILLLSNLNSRGDLTFLIAVAGGLLLTIGLWQVSSFTVGLKLKRHFKKTRQSSAKSEKDAILSGVHTNELLNEADLRDIVPPSVTENTTRNISNKVPR